MAEFKPGDRVYVTDPALVELRRIMRNGGYTPFPNHIGTVDEVDDESVLIVFDNEDGEAQGGGAPYPPDEVRHMPEPGNPVYRLWPWQTQETG